MVSNPLYNTHVVSYAVTAHPIVKHIGTFHYATCQESKETSIAI